VNQLVYVYNQAEQLQLMPISATPVGYQLGASMTFEEWLADGKRLNAIDKWKNFAIGDWLLQGENKFGEVCYQAIDEQHWGSYDKLTKLVWVARNVPANNRKLNLTWYHHHEVASLHVDEQAEWLIAAEDNQWSVRDLREAIKQSRQLPKLSVSFTEPSEAPFNHQTRNGIPPSERTAVDEYEQQDDELAGDEEAYTWGDDRSASSTVHYLEPQEQIYTNGAGKPHVSNNSGNNEWYTPPDFIEAARLTLGAIELDPATSEEANKVVRAKSFYTIDDDGLVQEWEGKVWMNPPYAADLVGRFVDKLIFHYQSGDVPEAVVLVNNATETQWFQSLAAYAKAICFPSRRIRFWSTDGSTGSPLQGQAILYLGPDPDNFIHNFHYFGLLANVAICEQTTIDLAGA
jgi:hypothetical protein